MALLFFFLIQFFLKFSASLAGQALAPEKPTVPAN